MQEDINAMLEEYPSWNEYWEDKRAKIDLINVPTYVVASFSTQIHTEGSFRGFEDLKIADKWYDSVGCSHLTLLLTLFLKAPCSSYARME